MTPMPKGAAAWGEGTAATNAPLCDPGFHERCDVGYGHCRDTHAALPYRLGRDAWVSLVEHRLVCAKRSVYRTCRTGSVAQDILVG
jgi:hypothetical protein